MFRATFFENSANKPLIAKINLNYFYNCFNFLFSFLRLKSQDNIVLSTKCLMAAVIKIMMRARNRVAERNRFAEERGTESKGVNTQNTLNTLYRLRPYSRRGSSCTRPCLARSFSCATFAIRAPYPVASLPCARSSYSSFHLRATERYI